MPAVLLGLVALGYLTDRPGQAGWLTPEERNWLTAEMDREEKDRERRHGLTLLQVLTDPRVWLLTVLYFTVAGGSAAVAFYLPKLLEGRFPELNKFQLGLLTAVPSVCAIVCMVLNGAHSDRTGERRWHVALPALLSAAGWAYAAWLYSPARDLLGLMLVPVGALSLLALTLAQVGILSMLPTFWSLPTAFLSGVAAAGGIALINAVGNLGGLAAPVIMGRLLTRTGSFTGGLLVMAAMMALGGFLALCVRHDPPQEMTNDE
jgi:ACS family tartrate transporter-like MFS transporter